MPGLSEEQRKFYENVMEESVKEMLELRAQMEAEKVKIRKKVTELARADGGPRNKYTFACLRLGIPNNIDKIVPFPVLV